MRPKHITSYADLRGKEIIDLRSVENNNPPNITDKREEENKNPTEVPSPTLDTTLQREAALARRPDLVAISSNDSLLSKYRISPEQVQIVSKSRHLTAENLAEIVEKKDLFLTKLLQAHEHALKNQKLKGSKFSNRQYASSLEFELTIGEQKESFWVVAGNFEMNIAELICGERGGMTVGINKAFEILPKEFVDSLPDDTNIEDLLKVKRLLMSSSKPIGDDKSAWQPCSDCYSWMGTFRFFKPDTQIISFYKDGDSNLILEARTLKDLLPREEIKKVSLTNKPIQELEIEYSDFAKEALKTNELDEDTIRNLIITAKTEYDSGENINKTYSNKNEAAALLFHDSNEIFKAKRVEWVPRWPQPADLIAAEIGIIELTKRGIKEPIIKAVAYYGDHEDLPSIKSNGRLAQKRGSKDVFIILIKDDVIKVRTILDYQPHIHGSVRQLSTNRTTV